MITALNAAVSSLVGAGTVKSIITATPEATYQVAQQLKTSNGVDLYIVIPIILVAILAVTAIFFPKLLQPVTQWLSKIGAAIRTALSGSGAKTITGDENIDKAIAAAGYAYDTKQDIFYSILDAWQRNVGYCRLYDEAAAPMGMIIDCEPIYFSYDSRRWLIELWKGQYDLTTGCEVGVYYTKDPDIRVPGIFKGTFYYCADNEDLLKITYCLKKNGKEIFRRDEKHWWLTGFKLGEFSEPSELEMEVTITLKDEIMRNAFIKGLRNAGYLDKEIMIWGNKVSVIFNKPRTTQPYTRIPETDEIVQKKNKLLCDKYNEITGPYTTFPEKVKAVKEQAPELYDQIINIGKNRHLYDIFGQIKNYLN